MKGEIDDQTWHELKYFEKEVAAEKQVKPVFNEALVLCGSLFDNIEPKSGISIKEN